MQLEHMLYAVDQKKPRRAPRGQVCLHATVISKERMRVLFCTPTGFQVFVRYSCAPSGRVIPSKCTSLVL